MMGLLRALLLVIILVLDLQKITDGMTQMTVKWAIYSDKKAQFREILSVDVWGVPFCSAKCLSEDNCNAFTLIKNSSNRVSRFSCILYKSLENGQGQDPDENGVTYTKQDNSWQTTKLTTINDKPISTKTEASDAMTATTDSAMRTNGIVTTATDSAMGTNDIVTSTTDSAMSTNGIVTAATDSAMNTDGTVTTTIINGTSNNSKSSFDKNGRSDGTDGNSSNTDGNSSNTDNGNTVRDGRKDDHNNNDKGIHNNNNNNKH